MTWLPLESKMFTSVCIRRGEADPVPAIPQDRRCLSLLRVPGHGISGVPRRRIQRPFLPRSHPRPLPLRAHGQTPRRLISQDGLGRTLTERYVLVQLLLDLRYSGCDRSASARRPTAGRIRQSCRWLSRRRAADARAESPPAGSSQKPEAGRRAHSRKGRRTGIVTDTARGAAASGR